MQLAAVIGTVVSTIKHKAYVGRKILMVQPLSPSGDKKGKPMIAVDTVQAGIGDIVLVMSEGGSARQILAYDNAPIRSTIVGIVDNVEIAQS